MFFLKQRQHCIANVSRLHLFFIGANDKTVFLLSFDTEITWGKKRFLHFSNTRR